MSIHQMFMKNISLDRFHFILNRNSKKISMAHRLLYELYINMLKWIFDRTSHVAKLQYFDIAGSMAMATSC
jgi:hypothetical protein